VPHGEHSKKLKARAAGPKRLLFAHDKALHSRLEKDPVLR
jgi:hypothetical protein